MAKNTGRAWLLLFRIYLLAAFLVPWYFFAGPFRDDSSFTGA
jgi:hypothetical protein